MTHQDFQQLSISLQREFIQHACAKLVTIPHDHEVILDLCYSIKGNFFIELYSTNNRDVALDINSFNFNFQKLEKFLSSIDISSVYDTLNDFD